MRRSKADFSYHAALRDKPNGVRCAVRIFSAQLPISLALDARWHANVHPAKYRPLHSQVKFLQRQMPFSRLVIRWTVDALSRIMDSGIGQWTLA